MASKALVPDPLDLDTGNNKGKKGSKAHTAPKATKSNERAAKPVAAKAKPAKQAKPAPQPKAKVAKPAKSVKQSKSNGSPRYGRRPGKPMATEIIREYFLKGGTYDGCFSLLKKELGRDNVKYNHVVRIVAQAKRNGWGLKDLGDDKFRLSRPRGK